MMTTTNTGGNPHLTRVYGLKNVEDVRALYDDWASGFDADMTDASQDYVAPLILAQTVVACGGHIGGKILDAGCGTGLVGVALVKLGADAASVDGIDLSSKMLDVARKTGAYAELRTADLSVAMEFVADATYDVLTCAGTLTHGHVGPSPALGEFVRVVKAGGIVVATVLDDIWASGGYEAEVQRLQKAGVAEIVSTDIVDYRKGAGVKCRMLVLRKK